MFTDENVVIRWVKHASVIVVLALSVYIGYGNADDITNTVTIWQRLIGVTATLYATLAVVACVGYWLRSRWLRGVLWVWVWAFLVIFTSALAAWVYGATGGSSLLVVAASAVLPALVLWAAHTRRAAADAR